MKKHTTTCFLSLFAVLLFSLTAAASWPAYFNRSAQEGWGQAARVVRTLGLRNGQTAADIGAGGGYFSVLLARAVGPGGRVYAVDISSASINHIRQYAAAQKTPNVTAVLAAADNPVCRTAASILFLSGTPTIILATGCPISAASSGHSSRRQGGDHRFSSPYLSAPQHRGKCHLCGDDGSRLPSGGPAHLPRAAELQCVCCRPIKKKSSAVRIPAPHLAFNRITPSHSAGRIDQVFPQRAT